jgi:hypothetical protein
VRSRVTSSRVGDSFDDGTPGNEESGPAEAPVRCSGADCAAVVMPPDTAGKLAEWASYKDEGTFWFCPEHKNLVEHTRRNA